MLPTVHNSSPKCTCLQCHSIISLAHAFGLALKNRKTGKTTAFKSDLMTGRDTSGEGRRGGRRIILMWSCCVMSLSPYLQRQGTPDASARPTSLYRTRRRSGARLRKRARAAASCLDIGREARRAAAVASSADLYVPMLGSLQAATMT